MKRDFSRLFHPKSVAVIGGGAWCVQVIRQLEKFDFQGEIWPVHPKSKEVAGHAAFARLEDLPKAPDASFIGINRFATVETVKVLQDMGAGGAVCFASGFSEASAEDSASDDLQAQLVQAAGDMPILGPNCYGVINAVDGAALWPDQHGCSHVDRGVAILTQSSNIAINLTNQQRGLPIAYVATCGNMAQSSQAEIAAALLEDERVTAIGLHIEGFSDLRAWERLAQKAQARSIPIVALKVGLSEQAQTATVSHTASLAGSDAGAQALLDRLGIVRVWDLPVFLETLKIFHMAGPLASNRVASISCSGGEASLVADTAHGRDVVFPPLNSVQTSNLSNALGPMVALANPLDYHTYIWRDKDAMTKAWAAMTDPSIGITMTIVDYPPTDAEDWECATAAAVNVHQQTGQVVAVVASLPELMPPDVAARLQEGGVIPLYGVREAVEVIEAASCRRGAQAQPLLLARSVACESEILTEAQAKAEFAQFGMDVPQSLGVHSDQELLKAAEQIGAPLVLKGQGIAHKTEMGAVRVGLDPSEVEAAARSMPTNSFLIEEMVSDGVAELLVGVTRDPAHGFVLTIAAGGILTELVSDRVSVLIPTNDETLKQALSRLKVAKLLNGYRGQPAAHMDAILGAIHALEDYVLANALLLEEAEINPLICTPSRAVVADALIRKAMS